jgi:hypothetical protein
MESTEDFILANLGDDQKPDEGHCLAEVPVQQARTPRLVGAFHLVSQKDSGTRQEPFGFTSA